MIAIVTLAVLGASAGIAYYIGVVRVGREFDPDEKHRPARKAHGQAA